MPCFVLFFFIVTTVTMCQGVHLFVVLDAVRYDLDTPSAGRLSSSKLWRVLPVHRPWLMNLLHGTLPLAKGRSLTQGFVSPKGQPHQIHGQCKSHPNSKLSVEFSCRS